MVDERKVPEGYKVTEVGVIPEDWELVPIGDIFKFKNGLNKAKQFFGEGTPIVNYMDVYKNRGIWFKDIRGKVTLSSNELANYNVQKGDVFFTRTSETPDEIGINSVLLDEPQNTTFSGFILRARSVVDVLDIDYKKYCFSADIVRKEIISKCTYTTRALTNGRVLSKVNIFVPPKPEQKAIAEALSDTDSLIQSVEKLIDKKKKIKQGAMQQLLTGKKRLPGFSGKWEVKKLSEICSITTGKKDVNEGNPNGEFPFFTCSKSISRSDTFSFDTEALLIAGNGDVGNMHYYIGKFEVYQRTYALYNFVKNPKFVQYYLELNLLKRIKENIIGSTIPYITIDQLLSFAIDIPKNTDEQKAIAQVLSDMDAEIEALEEKLEKVKTIKQGMMQELLTGRIRLI